VNPAAGHVNPLIIERKDSQIPKRNSLLNLNFYSKRHREIEISKKTTTKNNNNNGQKRTMPDDRSS